MANVNPIKYTRNFLMRVDDEFLAAVEELRRLETPIPSKSDVIRAAVMDALARKRPRHGTKEAAPKGTARQRKAAAA